MGNKNRFQYNDDLILDSALNLLQCSKKEEISIQSICKQAKISRTCFYSHFLSIESMYIKIIDQYKKLIQSYFLKEGMFHIEKKTYKEGFHDLLLFLKSNRKYGCIYKILNFEENPLYLYVYSEFLNECQKRGLEEDQKQNTWRFFSSGIQAVVSDWSQAGYKESIEEISDIFLFFIDKI